MNSIRENIESLNLELNRKAKLVAVSKTKPEELLLEAYDSGQRIFGENKVQELCSKYENLPKDIKWHMIGHLQKNKVKYIAPFVALVHSVDSMALAKEINKRALQNNRTIDILLQVKITDEETKFGLSRESLLETIETQEFQTLQNIRVIGLMGMASNTSDENKVRQEFKSLKQVFESIKKSYKLANVELTELSMGMSGDYKLAVEEGSTMVRVGSSIFGKRNYTV